MRFLMIHGFIHGFIVLMGLCKSYLVHSGDDKLICIYFKKLWITISDVIARRA